MTNGASKAKPTGREEKNAKATKPKGKANRQAVSWP
jgi:hypothetical protein